MNWSLSKLKSQNIFLIFLTLFSFVTSVINLGFPDFKTFDEIYRITRAEKFLHHQVFITDQPHFGKFIIILGMLTFGNNPIGWRITQAISGTLLVPLSYLIGKKIFKHEYAGLLTAFFVAFDLGYLAYSRIGVVVIFEVFFMALSLLLFMIAIEKNNKTIFFISAITVGLTVAIKWTGLCLLPILWFWTLTRDRLKNVFWTKNTFNGLFLIVVLATYLITFIGSGRNFQYYHNAFNMPNDNFFQAVIGWHKLALGSHLREGMTHPYASKWYTWPFLYKPVLLYETLDRVKNEVTIIIGLGNPAIWWASDLAILFQLFLLFFKRERDKSIIFLLAAYFTSLLPYAFIPRPMFLYHYMLSLFFSMLILEFTIVKLYKEKVLLRPFICFFISLVIGIFFYFFSLVNGYPITISDYNKKLWFPSWKSVFKPGL